MTLGWSLWFLEDQSITYLQQAQAKTAAASRFSPIFLHGRPSEWVCCPTQVWGSSSSHLRTWLLHLRVCCIYAFFESLLWAPSLIFLNSSLLIYLETVINTFVCIQYLQKYCCKWWNDICRNLKSLVNAFKLNS